ncbi:MAG: hypothetical protein CMP29_10870, partial [Roseibacillus sp.]|nr:hypothetical protein [Roseibacillus sp.]
MEWKGSCRQHRKSSSRKDGAIPSTRKTTMADRRYFGNIEEVIEPPNLIEVQSKSYEDFLQQDIAPSQRTETGLQAVFKEVFPITSYDETI